MGVAISLIPLILVLNVADGMINGITARFVALETAHIRAIASDLGAAKIAAEKLADSGIIRTAYPEIRTFAQVVTKGKTQSALVRGVPMDFLAIDPEFSSLLRVDDGEARFPASNSALISSEIARKLNIAPGDSFSIVTLKYNQSSGNYSPKTTILKASAIVSSGYLELDRLWLFVSLDVAARISDDNTSQVFVNIKTANRDMVTRKTFDDINDVIGPAYALRSWTDLQRSLFLNMNSTRMILLIVMALIVSVAAVNVSSAVLMIVLEKKPEIAIMRSIGATPLGISTVFILSGCFIGAIGAIVGIVVGMTLSYSINDIIKAIEWISNSIRDLFLGASQERIAILNPDYYLDTIPIHLDPWSTGLVFISVIVLSALASLIPARKASCIPPNEVMRRH